MNKLRVCVIGVGTMGSLHLNVFATMKETEVVGVADIELEKAETQATLYGKSIKCYTDYRKMIDELKPDAVAIAIPDSMHKEPVLAALAAGAHVLVEKPLATKLADSDQMIEYAKKCGKTLMVNFSHRWIPQYFKAKELVAEGKMGPVAMVLAKKDDTIGVIRKWKWLSDSTPAAFLSSHDIDLIRWIIGSEARSVYARAYKKVVVKEGYDTYDCSQAIVEFENGSIATFESGWILPDSFPTATDSFIQITCEHGVIQIPRLSDNLEVATDESYTYPKISIAAMINGKVQGAFRLSLEHFVECVTGGKEPMTEGYQARQVSEIVEGITRSIETGEVVKLPIK
jgi:predicted dehydrogenase